MSVSNVIAMTPLIPGLTDRSKQPFKAVAASIASCNPKKTVRSSYEQVQQTSSCAEIALLKRLDVHGSQVQRALRKR